MQFARGKLLLSLLVLPSVAQAFCGFFVSNLDVADGVREQFASFYGELFDATLAHAGGRAVVTEYAWQANSCDPCPIQPLDARDLSMLGLATVRRAAS